MPALCASLYIFLSLHSAFQENTVSIKTTSWMSVKQKAPAEPTTNKAGKDKNQMYVLYSENWNYIYEC